MRISGPVEFLGKDVGIDFLINEVAGIEFQNRLQGFQKEVSPLNNGRSAVETKASSRRELRHACLNDTYGQSGTKFPPAMPIQTSIVINEVGRIVHDYVGAFLNSP